MRQFGRSQFLIAPCLTSFLHFLKRVFLSNENHSSKRHLFVQKLIKTKFCGLPTCSCHQWWHRITWVAPHRISVVFYWVLLCSQAILLLPFILFINRGWMGAYWCTSQDLFCFSSLTLLLLAPLSVGVKTRPIVRQLKFWKLMNTCSQNQKMNNSD